MDSMLYDKMVKKYAELNCTFYYKAWLTYQ